MIKLNKYYIIFVILIFFSLEKNFAMSNKKSHQSNNSETEFSIFKKECYILFKKIAEKNIDITLKEEKIHSSGLFEFLINYDILTDQPEGRIGNFNFKCTKEPKGQIALQFTRKPI
jgi:hypothetical protein